MKVKSLAKLSYSQEITEQHFNKGWFDSPKYVPLTAMFVWLLAYVTNWRENLYN